MTLKPIAAILKVLLLALLLSIILLSHSCRSPEQIRNRKCAKAQKRYELAAYKLGCPWQIFDSIIIRETRETVRDTTIYITLQGESEHDTILLPVPGINTPVSLLSTRYAISRAWIENSLLMHTLEQKQVDIQATIKGAIHSSVSTEAKTVRVPYPVEVRVEKQLSKLQRFGLWSGGGAWLLAILYALYKFRKGITFPRWFG
jgi:hypothetical protein